MLCQFLLYSKVTQSYIYVCDEKKITYIYICTYMHIYMYIFFLLSSIMPLLRGKREEKDGRDKRDDHCVKSLV